MNYTKKLEDLSNHERCITNKKDYAKYNGIIIYKWEYITTQDIEKIKDDTSHNIEDIFKEFIIPTTYTEDEWRGTLDVSPLLMMNLIKSVENIKEEKEWKPNFINVTTNHNKERIFEFLIDLYEKFILAHTEDSDNEIQKSIHQLYTNIENILNNPEIWTQMEDYKKEKNLENRLNKDKNKIKSPIIKIQLEQIMLYINDFINCLDINIQSEIFKNIEWKWRKILLKKSKKYLYERYHTKELNYLLYQDYLSQFNYSIDQLYYSLEGSKQDVQEWEELPKANYYIEKLRNNILQHITSIKIHSKDDDDEIDDILNTIDEKFFDKFLRDYYELEEDDDTWPQSRLLSDDFSNINNYIEQIIINKEYQYINNNWNITSEQINKDPLSISWLFEQLTTSQDFDNTNILLQKLSECSYEELQSLSSEQSYTLINMIIKYDKDERTQNRSENKIKNLSLENKQKKVLMEKAAKQSKFDLAIILKKLC